MSEPITRRSLFRWLPLLPALPTVLGGLSTGRTIDASSATRLANGAWQHTRQTYAVLVNGGTRLIEDVAWVVRNGETVDGSTRWLKWQPRR